MAAMVRDTTRHNKTQQDTRRHKKKTVQKTVLVVDVPVISSDKFPQSRGSNPRAPDSVHPQSGEHSCCATDFRRDSTGAVLGVLGSC